MKVRTAVFLIAIMTVSLLSGCADTTEPSDASGEAPSTPMQLVSPTPAPVIASDPNSPVYTNWSKLTPYEPVTEVYSRLREERITELEPSDGYGTLIPFVGEYLYTEWGGTIAKYGLITLDGCIVLDAVCDSIWRMDLSGDGGFAYALAVGVRDTEDSESYRYSYAIADGSGRWVTDFEFSSVSSDSMGVYARLDKEGEGWGTVVCYDGDMNVVFDSRDFEVYGDFDELTYVDYGSEGFCVAAGVGGKQEKSACFVDIKTGKVLKSDEFDGWFDFSDGFNNGLARVYVNNKYGVLDTDGRWVLPAVYDTVLEARDGIAVVQLDGTYCAVDFDGRVIKSFDADSFSSMYYGDTKYYVAVRERRSDKISATSGNLETVWEEEVYDADFNLIKINGENAQFFYKDEPTLTTGEGIYFWNGGDVLFVPDAVEVGYGGIDGYREVSLSSGEQAILDKNGDILFRNGGENVSLSVTKDVFTGEYHIILYDWWNECRELYGMDGTFLFSGVQYDYPLNGLFRCEDSVSSGYRNLDGDWVFRVLIDKGD